MEVDLTRVVSKDPFDSMGIPREYCESCGGVGWLATLAEGNVERCDTCELYQSDCDAALACAEDIYIRTKGEIYFGIEAELLRQHTDDASSWRFYVLARGTLPFVIRTFFPEVWLLVT